MAIKCFYVPRPPVPVTRLISFISSAAPPPFSHQVQKRYQRYREERPCPHGQTGHSGGHPPPLSHQVFPYKQLFFTVSSVVPVERWKFIPPTLVQAAPLHFFPCITIRCKFVTIFSISLTFLAPNAFLSNVEF